MTVSNPGPVLGDQRVLVVAWTRIGARQREIAEVLNASHVVIPIPEGTALRKALGYLGAAVATWRLVRTTSATTLIASCPPIPVATVCDLARRREMHLILDSHPGAFGLMGDRLSRALQPLHRRAVRRADAVLVTTDGLAEEVRRSGGKALIFHEAIIVDNEIAAPAPRSRARVLFPGIFAPDEPIQVIFDAAKATPEAEFLVTGDPALLPADTAVPPNVTLVGFLPEQEYRAAVRGSDVVVVLSSEQESVMRTAYEATLLGRPLVVSDSPATRSYFPNAEHADNTAAGVAAAVQLFLEAEPTTLAARIESARVTCTARVTDQIAQLRSITLQGANLRERT